MTAVDVLMIGAGEYTTGYVHDGAAKSDKSAGVVALTMCDLRRQGLVDRLLLAATSGSKMPQVRDHLQSAVGRYNGLDASVETFPADSVESDPQAYERALDQLSPGDVVTVFTPDDTHYLIARHAIERNCHVLIAKPLVQSLDEHWSLLNESIDRGVLVAMEVHKRWDPMYVDARDRIRKLGPFSHFASYMSQPKSQLDTFRKWAGKSSDISYYLNAHHVDFHAWSVGHMARPTRVRAVAATGIAQRQGINTEDTITLIADWQSQDGGSQGTAIYTASWGAPKSDVHSQQRFHYMGHGGELSVDQAHRGYHWATDAAGYASLNPLFMKYEPDDKGRFVGQSGYGYRSIADFVRIACRLKSLQGDLEAYDAELGATAEQLATVEETLLVTAILEAGRRSLDDQGATIEIVYEPGGSPIALRPSATGDF